MTVARRYPLDAVDYFGILAAASVERDGWSILGALEIGAALLRFYILLCLPSYTRIWRLFSATYLFVYGRIQRAVI